MLYCFLPHNNTNQPQVYIWSRPPEPPSYPPAPSHPSRLPPDNNCFLLKNIKIIKKVTYNCHLSKVFSLKAEFCPEPGHQRASTDRDRKRSRSLHPPAVLLGTGSVKSTSLGHEYVTRYLGTETHN